MASLDTAYWLEPSHFLGAALGLSLLSVLSVATRFAARRKQGQPMLGDDWTILAAAAFTVGIAICMVYGVSQHALVYPSAPHSEGDGDAIPNQLSIQGQLQWAFIVLLPLALGCTKASFLLLYRRIFAIGSKSKTNVFLVGVLIFVILWIVAFFLASLFECGTEFWATWSSLTTFQEHCVDDLEMALAFAITDFIIDIIIFAIPIPLVWRLNLTLPKKIAVTSVFLIGLGTVWASITRVLETSRIVTIGHDPNMDRTLPISSSMYWGMVECGIAILVACMPTLWFFIKKGPWISALRSAWSITSTVSFSSVRLWRWRRSGLAGDEEDLYSRPNANGPDVRSEAEIQSVTSAQTTPTNAYDLGDVRIDCDFIAKQDSQTSTLVR